MMNRLSRSKSFFYVLLVIVGYLTFSFDTLIERLLTSSNECTRKVEVRVDAHSDSNLILSISKNNESVNNEDEIVSPLVSLESFRYTYWTTRRTFFFDLDDGSYSGAFNTWPKFAQIIVKDYPPCFDSFDITPPPIDMENCQLIRNGDFESCDDSTCNWYHTSCGVELVEDYVTGKALSTIIRGDPEAGLAHFLDTRCIVSGQHYKILAKVKLMYSEGNKGIPECDPFVVEAGVNRCPRGNLKYSIAGSEEKYVYDIGFTFEFNPGEWNKFWGYFVANDEMESADNFVFYIDGPKEGVNILLDDISMVPVNPSENNCIKNGDFELVSTDNWYCNERECEFDSPGYDGGVFAIKTITTPNRWSFRFNIEESCFDPTKKYVVDAWYKLEGGAECDPYLYYQGLDQFCPAIAIRTLKKYNQQDQVRAALTVGPFKKNDWNHLHGILDGQEMSLMLSWDKGYGYVTNSARQGVSILLDNVTIKEAGFHTVGVTDCTQLVRNGNAEIGDARFWYIKGSGNYGNIDLVSPGAGESGFAFSHTGTRTNQNQGLWQELDKLCMPADSSWEISAKFKTSYTCYKKVPNGPKACPRFGIEAFDNAGENVISIPLLNENNNLRLENSGWSNYRASFQISDQIHLRERIFIYVIVPQGENYQVDDITVTQLTSES